MTSVVRLLTFAVAVLSTAGCAAGDDGADDSAGKEDLPVEGGAGGRPETPREVIARLSSLEIVGAARHEIDILFAELAAANRIPRDEHGFTEAQLNHNFRCFLFARAFANEHRVPYDETGLFLVAMFHDIGLHPPETADFEESGAVALHDFLVEHHEPRDRVDHLPNAIRWHTGLLPVGLAHPFSRKEARLFQLGAYTDVFGAEAVFGLGDEAVAIRSDFPMLSDRGAILETIFRSKIADVEQWIRFIVR